MKWRCGVLARSGACSDGGVARAPLVGPIYRLAMAALVLRYFSTVGIFFCPRTCLNSYGGSQ